MNDSTVDAQTIAAAIEQVRERIATAADRAGRDAATVRLMAVSKTQPPEAYGSTVAAGLTLFGENRVQEIQAKHHALPPGAELHLIGHLQRNKVRAVLPLVDCIQSIDRVSVVTSIAAADQQLRTAPLPVFLEVNPSKDPAKHGVDTIDALLQLADAVAAQSTMQAVGLMTIAPFVSDERIVRTVFAQTRSWAEQLAARELLPNQPQLSMGMTGDFAWAIAEGSTLVRIGTALYGARS